MKKTFLFCYVCVIVLNLVGCSEDKIESWNGQGKAWFTSTDVTNCTFVFDPASTESKMVEIPITIASSIGKAERKINVQITRDKSNSSTKYELENPVVVPADSTSAVMKMKVYKTDNLALAPDTIVVKIISSSDFLPGLVDYQSKTIVLYNDFVEPDWWKVTSAKYTFGAYSKAKCKLYYQIIGNLDDPRKGESSWFTTLNCQLVKYKLDLYVSTYHPVDENGNAIDFSTY
jgi:hypothetical protein